MDLVRQAQSRMLTVDSYVGTQDILAFVSGMRTGGLDSAFVVVSLPQGARSPGGTPPAQGESFEVPRRLRQIIASRPTVIGFALSSEDAYRLEKEGRQAVFLGLENVSAIGTAIANISALHAEGISYLTLGEASDNIICDSALELCPAGDRGLSDFGRQVVAECNQVGMVIDLANCSERSVYDVVEISRSPVIVSHTGCRKLCDAPGNLEDEQIRAIAGKGGVIAISLESERLVPRERSSGATIADVVDHIDRVAKIGGIEAVGIGSGFGKRGRVRGCQGPKDFLNVTLELLRRGYGEHSVEAILGGNIMRALKMAEQVAETH